MDVDPRWMTIACKNIKLNGCRTLFGLCKKWLSQDWDEPCHQVLEELKSKFSSPPVLKFAEFDIPFEVHTGASDFTIGGGRCKERWPLHMEA